MATDTYTLKDVVELTGIARRRLVAWADADVVRPVNAARGGSGHPREYSADQLLECVLVEELLGLGLTVSRAGQLLGHVAALRRRWEELGALVLCVTPGGLGASYAIARGKGFWAAIATARVPEAGCFLVIDLELCRRRLRSRGARL